MRSHDEDAPDPPPRVPRYRVVSTRKPEAPGCLYVANDDSPSAPPLLVPLRAALALVEPSDRARREAELRLQRAEQSDALARSSRDAEPSGTAPMAYKPMRPKAANPVSIPDNAAARWAPRPRSGPKWTWVKSWEPREILPLIERHNEGTGSSDKDDRVRNAAAWQAQVDAGPWRKCLRTASAPATIAMLREEFGHIDALCSLIAERLHLAHVEEQPFTLPPILLVGQPGVGKTHAARRIAEILELPSQVLDMSTQQTNGRLHGSDKHWSNASPGLLRELMVCGEVANPVLILDELDKCPRGGSHKHYDPMAPLHAALEPASARRTQDQCIPGTFDASYVIYIATANTLGPIPASLLSRFQIVLCQPPGPREALALAKRIAKEVTDRVLGFEPADRTLIATVADRTPRQIRQLFERALARAVQASRTRMLPQDLALDDDAMRLH